MLDNFRCVLVLDNQRIDWRGIVTASREKTAKHISSDLVLSCLCADENVLAIFD